jgi:WD40 repeat protein
MTARRRGSSTRWIVAAIAGVAVIVVLLSLWRTRSRIDEAVRGPATTQPLELSPDEESMPEEPAAPQSRGAATNLSRPRVRNRTRSRPPVSATSPFTSTQPEPTSQAYVPGDAYVPPTTPPGSASPAPAATATAPHLVFTPDGKFLVIPSNGNAEFCDLASGQRRALGASLGDARIMTISADGRSIATLDAGGVVHLFDTSTWQAQTTTYTPGVADVTAIALSPDGRTIALAGKGVVIWDRVDQKPRVNLHANDVCTSVNFSADGHSLAVATAEGATIWETALWQKQVTLTAGGGAGTVHFWPARSALAVASGDHTIRVYDLSTRQVVTTLNTGDIADFALSADGRTIAGVGAMGVTVWDSTTGVARHLP